MPITIVCLAYQQSLEDQGYNSEHRDIDYARHVVGTFENVRLCYDNVEVLTPTGWVEVLEWVDSWWYVIDDRTLPGFSDIELRTDL